MLKKESNMWVTQTYLGKVEPDAKVFVYYLFEDYNPVQTNFTNAVQSELEKLGDVHKSNVSLFMPNPSYAARIENELRGIQELWWSLNGKLPGILISTNSLSEFDVTKGNYYFASFEQATPQCLAEIIQKLRTLIDEQLKWEFNNPSPKEVISWYKKLYEAIEAKPGLGGFKIDLKKLISRS
ncbi:MAG: hypothetical protein AB4062_14245 [Crocosphaera sp.]